MSLFSDFPAFCFLLFHVNTLLTKVNREPCVHRNRGVSGRKGKDEGVCGLGRSSICPPVLARSQEPGRKLFRALLKSRGSPTALGWGREGVTLASLVLPQFPSHSPERWDQMWRLKSPLVRGSQGSSLGPWELRQVAKGAGTGLGGRGRQECLFWEKVGSKHLEGPPGQRQTLRSLLLLHSSAPAPLPPAIRALAPSRPSRLQRHHGQVTPAAVAAAAAHPLWPRCR